METTTQSAQESTEQAKTTGVIKVLGKSGDVPITWDKNNAESTAVAERKFRGLRAEGYHAYRIDRGGQAVGSALQEFDPEAEEIIMFGQLQGG